MTTDGMNYIVYQFPSLPFGFPRQSIFNIFSLKKKKVLSICCPLMVPQNLLPKAGHSVLLNGPASPEALPLQQG